MKLIYAIIRYDNEDDVTTSLTKHKFSVTRLSTTGGFLKKGNTTLMIVTEPERVDEAITRRSPSICHMYPVPLWSIVQPCRCLSMLAAQRSSLWMLSGMKRSDNRQSMWMESTFYIPEGNYPNR